MSKLEVIKLRKVFADRRRGNVVALNGVDLMGSDCSFGLGATLHPACPERCFSDPFEPARQRRIAAAHLFQSVQGTFGFCYWFHRGYIAGADDGLVKVCGERCRYPI